MTIAALALPYNSSGWCGMEVRGEPGVGVGAVASQCNTITQPGRCQHRSRLVSAGGTKMLSRRWRVSQEASAAVGNYFGRCWAQVCPGPMDASEWTAPPRPPRRRPDRRLEEVAKAVGGGYRRLQTPLKLALSVRGTVAGHRLGARERGGGGTPPPPPAFQCIFARPHKCVPAPCLGPPRRCIAPGPESRPEDAAAA